VYRNQYTAYATEDKIKQMENFYAFVYNRPFMPCISIYVVKIAPQAQIQEGNDDYGDRIDVLNG